MRMFTIDLLMYDLFLEMENLQMIQIQRCLGVESQVTEFLLFLMKKLFTTDPEI
jgi:hypothetical protein